MTGNMTANVTMVSRTFSMEYFLFINGDTKADAGLETLRTALLQDLQTFASEREEIISIVSVETTNKGEFVFKMFIKLVVFKSKTLTWHHFLLLFSLWQSFYNLLFPCYQQQQQQQNPHKNRNIAPPSPIYQLLKKNQVPAQRRILP